MGNQRTRKGEVLTIARSFFIKEKLIMKSSKKIQKIILPTWRFLSFNFEGTECDAIFHSMLKDLYYKMIRDQGVPL